MNFININILAMWRDLEVRIRVGYSVKIHASKTCSG
jgi:hypothetical protein